MACRRIDANTFPAPATNLYADPKQSIQNCAFIAALSAVAWTTQKTKLQCVYTREYGGYRWYNVSFRTNWNTVDPIEVSNNLLGAGTFSGTIWVGLYEKAYANKYLACDYCLVQCPWPGNASFPLMKLTGCSAPIVTGDFYNKIVSRCQSGKTKSAMVIWTATAPDANVKPLRINHQYTVLGYTNDGYVILRDPTGALPSAIAGNYCRTAGNFNFDNNFVARDCLGSSQTAGINIGVNFGQNGIVGVNQSGLATYFAGLTYTT